MKWKLFVMGVIAMGLAVLPLSAAGEDLVKESLATFSPATIRLEFARPATLRTLPNYASLSQRYVAPRLRALQDSFAKLGVGENDIDEVLLAWRPGSSAMDLDGLVAGRFTARSMASRATANGITASEIGGQSAYCLDATGGTTCLVVLRDGLGAFGTQDGLSAMMDIRSGTAPNLSTNERLTKLLGEASTQAPIWGVAVGEAVPDWFRAWMPGQGNLQLDWSKAFQSVEALVYSVEIAGAIKLDAKMDCTEDQAAESTRQVFEGLRMFQQMAWQSTNPGKPNPFQAVEIARDGRRVSLKMTTSFNELQAFPTSGVGL
jgi:hypothetical protein